MTRKSIMAKPMTLEEIKLGYLRLDWESKVNVLREAKNKEDLGEYLTLLTWLDETPVRYGGVPIHNIPDEAVWSCS